MYLFNPCDIKTQSLATNRCPSHLPDEPSLLKIHVQETFQETGSSVSKDSHVSGMTSNLHKLLHICLTHLSKCSNYLLELFK